MQAVLLRRTYAQGARYLGGALTYNPLNYNNTVDRRILRVYGTKPPHPSESFLSGSTANALEAIEEQWKHNPESVDPSWQKFFEHVERGAPPGEACNPRRTVSAFAQHIASPSGQFDAGESIKLFNIVRSYRVFGHFKCKLDPLNLEKPYFSKIREEYFRELSPEHYGFDLKRDLDREFFIGDELPGGKPVRTLREVLHLMENVYCGNIGVQYMHIANPTKKNWFRERFESRPTLHNYTNADKQFFYRYLAQAELFENFLAMKFKAKRFGLDGGESLIPGMKAMLEDAGKAGIEAIVLGMPHRGRLNVLCNIVDKPLEQLFSEFRMAEEAELAKTVEGSGDVKYHLGTSQEVPLLNGRTVHVSMTANPSHLEAVNPVVEGKARAKQTLSNGTIDHNKAMAVLIHGDAAFAGQGVVGETLELAGLKDFSTGGTIHVVVNNQIGFTTVPKYARTSPYPTEMAKGVGCPILHVNGDNVEAVVYAFQTAVEYRQKFNSDIVIDIVCYRRYGHNELDEPKFTQPKMYEAISKHSSVLKLYEKELLDSGIDPVVLQTYKKQINDRLHEGFQRRESIKTAPSDWLESRWKGFKSPKQQAMVKETAFPLDRLRQIGTCLTTKAIPKDFELHKKLVHRLNEKEKMLTTGTGFDWSTGELLAYASLLDEGFSVRLSGQDCERGTFSHRHAVLYDQKTENTFTPLHHVAPKQGNFHVINSSLSENAVLGFEHGYSIEDPNTLVLWEAQFGDFANGAQVVIDTFIASGEQKWLRMSGLTMLLPHGFEGQGPEHSSARMERYLQLCDDHPNVWPDDIEKQHQEINMQVCNITTPANYFHLLRRQLHREFRKPLIVMTPKRLLGYPRCTSDIEDFGPGSSFQRVYGEVNSKALNPPEKIKRLVLCSGHIYYVLTGVRDGFDIKDNQEHPHGREKDVAIIRLEEIAPFPFDLVEQELKKYPNAELIWCQEEPMNAGAWSYVAPRIETADRASKRRPRYIGRDPAAAPATGFGPVHKEQTQEILRKVFTD